MLGPAGADESGFQWSRPGRGDVLSSARVPDGVLLPGLAPSRGEEVVTRCERWGIGFGPC